MILGLVVGALAGATADEEEFNCFISLYPIPFAPPRSPLPTPLYPRAMAGGGGFSPELLLLLLLLPSPAILDWLEVGEARIDRRRRRRRAKVGGRQEGL